MNLELIQMKFCISNFVWYIMGTTTNSYFRNLPTIFFIKTWYRISNRKTIANQTGYFVCNHKGKKIYDKKYNMFICMTSFFIYNWVNQGHMYTLIALSSCNFLCIRSNLLIVWIMFVVMWVVVNNENHSISCFNMAQRFIHIDKFLIKLQKVWPDFNYFSTVYTLREPENNS